MRGNSVGKRDVFLGGICLVTDKSACSLTCVEMAVLALKAGIRFIQLRDKENDRLGLYRTAVRLREITRDFGACFIVNDHADIAASVEADGVHLGQEDLPVKEARKVLGKDKFVGVSTHSMKEALAAEEDGADYIGFGPVFNTTTKQAGSPRGTDMLMKIRESVKLPVVAIGGICLESLDEVFASGANAVAAASGILSGQVHQNAKDFVEKVRCF